MRITSPHQLTRLLENSGRRDKEARDRLIPLIKGNSRIAT